MSKPAPLISVIIPTHNRANWLPGAVKSAQEAGTNVEVVVVDDASTDHTPQVCKTLQGVRVVRLESNAHLAGARNAGIAASTGEYLAFLDDDDRRLPGSLDAQLSVLEEDPGAAFVYGPVLVGDEENCEPTGHIRDSRHSGDIFWQLFSGNFIYVASVLVRRTYLEEVGTFDRALRGLEDWDLWIRLAERYRVRVVEHPVGIYRVPSRGSDQMSNNQLEMCRTSARLILKALDLPRAQNASATERRTIRRNNLDYLSRALLHEGELAAFELQFGKAATHALEALRVNPLHTLRPRNWMRLPGRMLSLSKTWMAGTHPGQTTIPNTGERHMTHDFNCDSLQHLHRYALARMFCKEMDVADVACGEGFGSNLLAQVARHVTGVDISDEVIAHARRKYGRNKLTFIAGGVANLPLADGSVDVVVSIETLEHHDQHDEMLSEIKRVLRPNGVLIISTPEKLNYSDRPAYANPFHVKELYLEQFRALIASYFKQNAMLFQKLTYGSLVVPETPGCGFEEFSGDFDHLSSVQTLDAPITNICIASDAELPAMGPSLFEGMGVVDNVMQQTRQLFLNSRTWRIGRVVTWPLRKFVNR